MSTAKFAAAFLTRNLKLKIWQTKDLATFTFLPARQGTAGTGQRFAIIRDI